MRRRSLALGMLVSCCVLAAAITGPAASGGAGPRCRTSTPSFTSATVEVCITAPTGPDPLVGDTPVEVSVVVSNGQPVDEVILNVDGQPGATDDEAPYGFVVPTDRYADGEHTFQVNARVRFTQVFTTPKTRLPVVFDNGNSDPPPPRTGFEAPVVPASRRNVVVAATGDGVDGGARAQSVIDGIVGMDPDLFLYLGDVYERGTNEEFASWYGSFGQRWSALAPVTAPTVGNHEYHAPAARPYFDYWAGVPHFYAFDAGAWRVIVLDSTKGYGGYAAGSPQYNWLAAELAESENACTLISVHHPRHSVGKYVDGSPWLQETWALAASNGVDIFLTGHDHNYQRWKPLGPLGLGAADGMRQFVAGTGGHESYAIQRSDSRVATAIGMVDGAIRFNLRADRARFAFVEPDGTELDAGGFRCSPAIGGTAAGTST